jgi:hypothetical protein
MERYRVKETATRVNNRFVLPCDVTLGGPPPHTTVQAGCLLRTLITALQVRQKARRSIAEVIEDEQSA